MTRLLLPSLLCLLMLGSPAQAQELMPKPDDRVILDVAGEEWVTTKTAEVTVAVEAAVTASNAGTMRSDMVKAVNDLSKGDWRLTSFNRSQDQTGLERWSAMYVARLPENQLNGLQEAAKKLSKAGMQVTVSDINFSPTLEEMEAARATLRAKLYKSASDQLAALNAALPGRTYRIGTINFTGNNDEPTPMPRVVRGQANMAMMAMDSAKASPPMAPMERAEKITLSARIVYAADSKVAPK